MIRKQSILVLALIALIALITASCTNGLTSVESYMIAYIQEGTGNVRIRYAGADTAEQWRDGQSADGGNIHGGGHLSAGLGSYHTGGTAILGTLVGNTIELRVGIGALFSDDADDLLPNAGSSPSFAHIDDSEYLIAYQLLGTDSAPPMRWLKVRPYDHSPGSDVWEGAGQMFAIGNSAPNDNYLVGRPAIAYRKDDQRVLVVWFRSGATVSDPNAPPPRTVQYALGTYPYVDGLNTIVKWTEYGEIPAPAGYIPFHGVPSLATDGESFYLAIVRQPYSSGEGLHGLDLFIYESSNGSAWTQVAIKRCPIPYTFANIAVQPDGEMLVGMIASGEKQNFYLVEHGDWIELDAMRVLGSDGGPNEFEIVTRIFLTGE